MLPAGLVTCRVGSEGIRVGADLIGDEPEQWLRWLLTDAQQPPGMARQTQLHSEAETVLFAAPCLHQLQILVAEQVLLGELRGFRWQGLEDRALGRGEDCSTGHEARRAIVVLE